MTRWLFTPVISVWKACHGANVLPVQKTQTLRPPGTPGPAPPPRPPHAHLSSIHGRLSQSLGNKAGFGAARLLCLWNRRLKSTLTRSLAFAAPGLRFCREASVSSQVFRQLSASRAWNISLLSATRKESQFLLYPQKIKPEEVAQSNSNRLSGLQPNGHN